MSKAPIVITDSTILGDRLPRDADSIAQLKERNLALREPHKIVGQKLLEDHAAAQGGPMDPREFIRRLHRMEPRLIIEPGGYSNCVSLKIPCLDDDTDSPDFGKVVPMPLASGFPVDRVMQEFSSVATDKDGVASREIRGWRTVLLRLIISKAVTYQQVKAEFGEPLGTRGSLWMQQLREHRA